MVVLTKQREFQDALERDPIEFLAPEGGFLPRLDSVRVVIANQVGANASDIAWVARQHRHYQPWIQRLQ